MIPKHLQQQDSVKSFMVQYVTSTYYNFIYQTPFFQTNSKIIALEETPYQDWQLVHTYIPYWPISQTNILFPALYPLFSLFSISLTSCSLHNVHQFHQIIIS